MAGQRCAHLLERFAVGRVTGEVFNIVRIGLEVIQLFGWFLAPKHGSCGGEFSGGGDFCPGLIAARFEHVLERLDVGEVGPEVMNVEPPPVHD